MHIYWSFSCNLLICTFPSISLPALPRASLSCKISEIFRPNNHCRANALDEGPGTKDPVAPIGFKGRRIENFAHRGEEENRWEHFPQLSLPLPFLLSSSQLGIPNIRYDIRRDPVYQRLCMTRKKGLKMLRPSPWQKEAKEIIHRGTRSMSNTFLIKQLLLLPFLSADNSEFPACGNTPTVRTLCTQIILEILHALHCRTR